MLDSNTLPVLYSFRRCPYAMRARLALAASGQRCYLREVVLRNKPDALLQISPKATVPVLQLPDGTVIDESLDIMLWALQGNDPQQWLAPPMETLAGMLKLIGESDSHFKFHLDRYKYPVRYNLPDGLANRAEGAAWLAQLEARLAAAPYLYGERPALADMAIFPFVRQFAHTDKNWFQAQPWPHLLRWLQTGLESPLFLQIMHKYPAWTPGTPGELFPS